MKFKTQHKAFAIKSAAGREEKRRANRAGSLVWLTTSDGITTLGTRKFATVREAKRWMQYPTALA